MFWLDTSVHGFRLRHSELRESCFFMYCGLFNDAVSGLDYVLVVTNNADDDQ